MKFTRISLENFRQFYGKCSIQIAADSDRNITVLYGANGSGKTSLLNAFSWVLYGKFSPDFEMSQRLINERAWDEADTGDKVCTRVSIEFTHEGRKYIAERTAREEKNDSNSLEDAVALPPTLECTDDDGEHYKIENPFDFMDQLLPERLHRFFFFNGERIEDLAKETAYKEIQDAVKSVLGLEVVERSIRHLNGKVRQQLNQEWEQEGTEELAKVQQAMREKVSAIDNKNKERQLALDNKRALSGELEVIKEKLRNLKHTELFQKELDRLEEDLQGNQANLKEIKKDIMKHCNKFGFYAFTPQIIEKAQGILDNARERGEIPSGIKRQFVDDLLELKKCICNRPLSQEDQSYQAVSEWRSRAGLGEVEEEVSRTSSSIENFQENYDDLYTELIELLRKRSNRRKTIQQIEEQISENEKKLRNVLLEINQNSDSKLEVENLEKLRERREGINRELGQVEQQIKSMSNEISELERDRSELEKQIKQLETKSEKEAIAKKRVVILDETLKALNDIFEQRCIEVREQLQNRISRFYKSISFKPYEPKLTEEYYLLLTKQVGDIEETVAKSTGENQILSLSFIGSLVDYAREIYENTSQAMYSLSSLSFKGGIYPLVIDSPFGNLDDDYRQKIADGIPELAPQIILMVSKSQGLGNVKEEISPYVGKVYVLSYFTHKSDVKNDNFTWNGRSYNYIQKSSMNYEYAEILEVDDA